MEEEREAEREMRKKGGRERKGEMGKKGGNGVKQSLRGISS